MAASLGDRESEDARRLAKRAAIPACGLFVIGCENDPGSIS
jgi:hypothetical protein